MNSELIELGRRAVACEGWRWMEGMTALHFDNFDNTWQRTRRLRDWKDAEEANAGYRELEGALPDLSDPATLGCLLALVRETWKDPDLTPLKMNGRFGHGWTIIYTGYSHNVWMEADHPKRPNPSNGDGWSSDVDALVTALEIGGHKWTLESA